MRARTLWFLACLMASGPAAAQAPVMTPMQDAARANALLAVSSFECHVYAADQAIARRLFNQARKAGAQYLQFAVANPDAVQAMSSEIPLVWLQILPEASTEFNLGRVYGVIAQSTGEDDSAKRQYLTRVAKAVQFAAKNCELLVLDR